MERQRLFLGSLDIEFTERCNNNCVHCYINLPATDLVTKKRELSTIKREDLELFFDLGPGKIAVNALPQ